MAFSGALTLTDLNDYLGPSQACIKPVSGKDAPVPGDELGKGLGGASTEIAIDADGEYYESSSRATASQSAETDKPRARTRLEAAEISLNDCLACSGCVTSAESVLIGMQSVDELRKVVERRAQSTPDAPTHLVASFSPQSLASISAKYSTSLANPISLQDVLRHVEAFLKSRMQFDIVIDTSFARHVALAEQAREFEERRTADAQLGEPGSSSLPMLASACPGWICYAEKTHGELIPLISKTRSPQQIAGVMAKRYLVEGDVERLGGQAPRVYHMTVMPCYDKKLEASRQDFFDDITQTRDVDLVITTGELDDLMQAEGYSIGAPLLADHDTVMTPPGSDNGTHDDLSTNTIPSLLQQPGSSSGSYLFDLMRRIWMDHIEKAVQTASSPVLSVKTIRSADYTEYILRSTDGSGRILFKGAQCYGFRNLQNLVRKVQRQTGLKSKKAAAASLLDGPSNLGGSGARRSAAMRARGRGGMVRRGRANPGGESSPLAQSGDAVPASEVRIEDEESRGYDFVEVMACPGGCVNGGGQIRPPGQANGTAGSSSTLTARAITADVTEAILDGVSDASVNEPEQSRKITKSLDPEGFSHGWTTPPWSVSSDGDVEAAPAPMEGDEEAVQGWKGTSKEWVKRVEYLYWQTIKTNHSALSPSAIERFGAVSSVHQAQALGVPRDEIEQRVSQAIKFAAAQVAATSKLDKIANRVIESMCRHANQPRPRDKSVHRSELLRTQYRALQDEAVSGLAVQW